MVNGRNQILNCRDSPIRCRILSADTARYLGPALINLNAWNRCFTVDLLALARDAGKANSYQFAFMLSAWGTAGGDLNGDGLTNGVDLATMLSGWGACG